MIVITYNITNLLLTDTEDPVCSNVPDNIASDTDTGQPTAVTSWALPTTSDNSNDFTTTSNFQPGYSFGIGSTTVVYTVTDAAGLSVTCQFDVEVTGKYNVICL